MYGVHRKGEAKTVQASQENGQSSSRGLEDWAHDAQVSIHDFFVEVFGSLVPGVLFLAAFALSLILPLYTMLGRAKEKSAWELGWKSVRELVAPSADRAKTDTFLNELQVLGGVLTSYSFLVTIALLFLCYVIGHLFFRRDPDDADKESFRHLQRKIVGPRRARTGWIGDRLHALSGWLGSNYERVIPRDEDGAYWKVRTTQACESGDKCSFPYPDLDWYLCSRRLCHLMWFVNPMYRGKKLSKAYVSILKIRLASDYPRRYATIARNEAHVRMLSSMWYVCRAAVRCALFGCGIGVAVFVLRYFALPNWGTRALDYRDMLWAMPSILLVIFALAIRRSIEGSLHYTRVREIVFLLESAYWAYCDTPAKLLDVFPDFGKCGGPGSAEVSNLSEPPCRHRLDCPNLLGWRGAMEGQGSRGLDCMFDERVTPREGIK